MMVEIIDLNTLEELFCVRRKPALDHRVVNDYYMSFGGMKFFLARDNWLG
jgi:hypothetical protein